MVGDLTDRLNVNSIPQVYSAFLPAIILYPTAVELSRAFREKIKRHIFPSFHSPHAFTSIAPSARMRMMWDAPSPNSASIAAV